MSLVRHLVTHREEVARKAYRYLRTHGVKATAMHAVEIAFPTAPLVAPASSSVPSADELVRKRFPALAPLPIYSVPRTRPRINLITDNINAGSLYGGVGTSLIFMMLLAERLSCDLRIITRHARANETNFKHIAELIGARNLSNIEFKLCPEASTQVDLDVGEKELFITTSWWTTWPTLQAVGASRVAYILQEDERMFYSLGDDRLRCSELLSNPDLFFIVNTRRLFDWLGNGDLPNVARNGICFEPAFPEELFYYQPRPQQSAKSRLVFYARPNHVRNLFYLGVEALEQALVTGAIDPERWELHLVGKDIPEFTFSSSIEVHRHENLSWRAYAELVRSMDLGLSLMYTPHPSYPPLDLAASGAVVVTNRFGSKQDLDEYSKNILCVEPSVDELVRGIKQGVKLAADTKTRQANFRASGINRDWRASFADSIDVVLRRFFS